jgi:hypothetical protein
MPLFVQLAAGSLAILGCLFTYTGTIFPAAPKWVILTALAFLGILCWKRQTTTTAPSFLIGLLFAWIWFTGWWAVDPGAHTLAALRMTVLVVIAISVTKAPRIVIDMVPIVAALSTLGALVLVYFLPVSYGGFGNQNAITSFLILSTVLSWGCGSHHYNGVCMLRASNRWWGLSVAATIFSITYLLINDSILEFAVLGFVALVMAASQVKSYRTALYFGLLLGAVLWAIAWDVGDISHSFSARLEIWRDAVRLIPVSTWIGNGLGGFSYLHGDVQTTVAGASILTNPTIFHSPFMMPGYVHNDLLQLIIEGGLIGFGISLALIVALWRRSRNAGLHVHLTLLAGLALMLGDFAAQNPDTGLMIALAVGLAARSERPHKSRLTIAEAGILGTLLVVAAFELTASWKAEMMFSDSIMINAQHPPLALTLSRRALQIQPREAYVRRFAAVQLSSAANWCEINPKCEATIPFEAADEIYRVAQTAGPGFVGLLVSRAQYLLNSDRWNEPELSEIADRLESSFPLYAETWIVKAWLARNQMQINPLILSLKRLSEMGLSHHNKANLRRLLSTVTITPNPLAGKLED